jgi:large subunit ribosomal protein L27
MRNFATKLQASSTRNNKDSAGKRLGVKKFGGEEAYPNDILMRQRGTKWKSGLNTAMGKDHTIHSQIEGEVKYTKEYQGRRKITAIHVIPKHHLNRTIRPPLPYCYHPEQFPELAANNPEPFKPSMAERKGKAEQVKRKDYPVKFGSGKDLFKIELPEHVVSQVEVVQKDADLVDIFDEFTEKINSRIERISEHLNNQKVK